jgi:hypothetical protein
MGTFFALIFLGLSFLAGQLGVLPDPTEQETVISQVTRSFVGAGTPFHYLVQVSTAVILILAANTHSRTPVSKHPRPTASCARLLVHGVRPAFSCRIIVLAAITVDLWWCCSAAA